VITTLTPAMKLLIVESPAKCKKIQGYLGSGWRVTATMGHIRALKEDLDGIGFRTSWTPTYECIKEKSAAIHQLRTIAKTIAPTDIYLGSDDDREGEAIAWHTCAILQLNPSTTHRILFHEITESALTAAVASPTHIDMNKFLAQQARSMLDFLLGYTLSPMLWKGVGYKPGLSAGRCQTPALRILYDRDRDIAEHQSVSTWKLTATTGTLLWNSVNTVPCQDDATTLLDHQLPDITITSRTERKAVHQAPSPFITSSLQQEASARLSMNPKTTMRLAQTLYEEGHITYMRTDNPVLSQDAMDAAKEYVRNTWGEDYTETEVVKGKGKRKGKDKGKADVQAAHEAIRPTHMDQSTVDMPSQEQRLYAMIWKRTIQSVMKPEVCDVVKLSGTSPIEWETEWSKVSFHGWRMLDAEHNGPEEKVNAELFVERATLEPPHSLPWSSLQAAEHHTTPLARLTEASLIRDLETRGIGRPSTYASLVETVLDRGYVEKATIEHPPKATRRMEKLPGKNIRTTTTVSKPTIERDKLRTTALGRTVMEWLLQHVGDMIAYDQTIRMEEQLDEIANGTRLWQTILTESWGRYADRYDAVMALQTPSQSNTNSKSANYGDGYKMVVSKKGPLFVLEKEGEKTRFAKVPQTLSLQTATRADAEAAFLAATQAVDILGDLEGESVQRKKGPYGYYVTWRSTNLACSVDDTLESIRPKLLEKVGNASTAVHHIVGPYTIRNGQYGLYMYKATSSNRKPTFVSIPDATPWASLTSEGAGELYKHCLAAKKEKAKAKRRSKD
jgi:DNA topoisomerase-1